MLNIFESIAMYMLVMLWTGIFICVAKIKKNNNLWRISFDIFAAIPMFFIMAFRYDVGTDYFFTYIPNFNKILNGALVFSNERGFYLLYKGLQFFTTQSQSIIILTSFIYVFFLIWTIDENSNNPLLSFIVLFLMTFFFIALNNIRQQLATIIVVWGIRYVKRHQFAPYLTIIILAMYFFHQSIVLLLLVYPLFNCKLLRKICYIWMPILLLCSPLMAKLFLVILKIMGYKYGDMPSFEGHGGNYILVIQNSIIIFYLLISFRKKILKENLYFGLFAVQFVALLISVMTYWLNMLEIPDRAAYYFMIYQIISIPLAFGMLVKDNLIVCSLASVLMIWLFAKTFSLLIVEYGYHEVLPYQFVFDHWDELKLERPNKMSIKVGGNYELSYTYCPNYGKNE